MRQRPVRVALLISADSVGARVMLGFCRIAAAKGWECQTYLMTAGGAEALKEDDPDVVITGIGVRNEPGIWPAIEGRVIVALFEEEETEAIPLAARLDNRAIGAAAARHLLDRGLRSFMVCGIAHLPFAEWRAAAFAETILAAGGTVAGWEDGHILAPTGTVMIHRLPHVLARLPRPLGVFTPCDEWGKILASQCHRLGVHVPDHLAIISADNNELACTMSVTPLSSIVIPWARVGQEAALMADRLLRGRPAGKPAVIGPGPVVTRRSSQVTVVDDRDVSAALSFIRENAQRPIGVPDVVRAAVCSRRRLEVAFRRLLGSSILEVILDARIEQVKELLASTDLSVTEISGLSGFRDASALASKFRQRVGCTATQYRVRVRLRGAT